MKIDIVVRHLKECVSNARGSGDAIKGNAWINGSGWTIGSIEKVPMEEDIAHTYCQRARLYAFLGHIEEAKEDLDTAAMLDQNIHKYSCTVGPYRIRKPCCGRTLWSWYTNYK